MIAARRRVNVVYGALVALTFAALVFTSGSVHEVLSPRVAAACAAVIAFAKAAFVAMDFMELRGTPLQRWVQGWFVGVGVVCIVLILR